MSIVNTQYLIVDSTGTETNLPSTSLWERICSLVVRCFAQISERFQACVPFFFNSLHDVATFEQSTDVAWSVPIPDALALGGSNHPFQNQIQGLLDMFWTRLTESHTNKRETTPVAIIFLSTKKDCRSPIDQAFILEIAKTHRIALAELDDASFFGQKITDIAQQVGKKPNLLVVHAHGEEDQIQFGTSTLSKYTAKHIHENDFSDLDLDARIILISCGVGVGLAQTMANIAHRTVVAAKGNLTMHNTMLTRNFNSKYSLYSLNQCGSNHVFEFSPNKRETLSKFCKIFLQDEQPCLDVVNYIGSLAHQDDAEAQFQVGVILSKTDSYSSLFEPVWISSQAPPQYDLSKTIQDPDLYWLDRAASNGHSLAQCILGLQYTKGSRVKQSDERALDYYHQAAEGGCAKAQYYLGRCYAGDKEETLIPLSIITAARQRYLTKDPSGNSIDQVATAWYLRAAEGGNINAQYFLGRCYYLGRGITYSIANAAFWYRVAARQQHDLAIQELLQLGISIMPAYLGISFQPSDEANPEWTVISEVFEDLPAAQAGLQSGDILLNFNKKQLKDTMVFKKPGDQIQLSILRGDKNLAIDVTLGSDDVLA